MTTAIMDSNIVWLVLIVLISFSIQAMSGFGSTIMALTLGVHLYPIEVLLPVLVPLDLLVNLYIVTRHHHHLDLSLLSRKIIPAMGVGLLAGIMVFHFIEGDILKKIFGILVIVLSSRELYRLFGSKQNHSILSNLKSSVYIIAAGFIHGIYASGGPLLIYAVGRLNLSKSVFRSTLGAVWLVFAIILTVFYIISGILTADSLKLLLILLPVIVIGIMLGEWLHHQIDEYRFKIFVFAVLVFAGLSIIIA